MSNEQLASVSSGSSGLRPVQTLTGLTEALRPELHYLWLPREKILLLRFLTNAAKRKHIREGLQGLLIYVLPSKAF